MKQFLLIFILLMLVYSVTKAGTLTNGVWSPSGCGEKPQPPVVDTTSAVKFNSSIDAINEWQDRALAYNSCLIKEANADSALITQTANEAQAKLQQEIDRVVTEADRARAELDGR